MVQTSTRLDAAAGTAYFYRTERSRNEIGFLLYVWRLGGDFDEAPEQGELVGGVFGFVSQDAQQILIDVSGHGAILNPWVLE